MKLIINNLGAIRKIEIDLSKKLTLFCGLNSTGKTYVSYIYYAFLESYNTRFLNLGSYIKEIKECGCFTLCYNDVLKWLNSTCENLKDDLGVIFGISDDTKNKLFDKVEIKYIYTEEDFTNSLECDLKPYLSSLGIKEYKTEKEGEITFFVVETIRDSNKDEILQTIVYLAMRLLVLGHNGGVRMLTVERNSIYTFKTELSLSRNELIDRIQQNVDRSEINIYDLIGSSSRRYPLAVRNSLRVANDLDNIQKKKGPYADIADMIEEDLLYGEVSTTKNGDVEFHSKSMSVKKRLPFHLSSSIVKTMASLVVYLRHLANEGDTLIIDEPEMNFHPNVQVILARIFAILIHRNLHLVISTHSDYIVREINNLIMVDSLRRNAKGGECIPEDYTEKMSIPSVAVQVLLFDYTTPRRKNVTVKPVDVDSTGFSISTIDDTIECQNLVAQKMYDALLGDK